MLLCPLGHHASQHCNLRGLRYCNRSNYETGRAGRSVLTFCRSHNTVDGNLLLINTVIARRACARAEDMFLSHSASAAGGTDASHLSLANGEIVLLLASTLSFRTGLHRNTHPWTEKTAECGKGLYYQRAGQELMEITVGMVTKCQWMPPICSLILVPQSRGEDEELVLPLIQRHLCYWDPERQFTPTSFPSSS